MSKRRPAIVTLPETEDGSDPRRFHDRRGLHRPPAPPGGRPPGRKALQLARQVEQVLAGLFAASADDDLRGLTVLDVAPAPTTVRMLVRFSTVGDPAVAEAALARAGGWLRGGVAEGINRRLVPELLFTVGGERLDSAD